MSTTFQQLFSFSAATPAISGPFTPFAANDLIGIFAQDGAGSTTPVFSGTGAGAWSNVGAPISKPGGFNLSAGANLTETAAAQTATVTAAAAAFRCWGFDYSGVVSVGSFTAVQSITPGVGAGAILGSPVTVPSGSTLVALCIDTSAGTPAITATAGTGRGSSSLGGMAYTFVEYVGSGASVTPTFTHAGGATDTFNVMQMLLTGAGGAGAVLAGAATDAVSATGALSTGSGAFAPNLIGLGTVANDGTGDPARTAFGKIDAMVAQIFGVRSLQTPTTGFTIAAAQGLTQLVLNPAGTLATGTVTFPPNPGDNQPFLVMTSQAVTALTANTSDGSSINGAPTTIAANMGVKFRYVTSLNKWLRD